MACCGLLTANKEPGKQLLNIKTSLICFKFDEITDLKFGMGGRSAVTLKDLC